MPNDVAEVDGIQPNNLLLLLLKLKHKLTKDAMENFAKVVNTIGGESVVGHSMYQIQKTFASGKQYTQVHHVCKQFKS